MTNFSEKTLKLMRTFKTLTNADKNYKICTYQKGKFNMKFDSTNYLLNALVEKMHLDSKTIENILRILNGFIVIPNSIKYDERTKVMSLAIKLPNSTINICETTIHKEKGINLVIKSEETEHLMVLFNASILNLEASYSICLSESKHAGLYYFNSSLRKKEDGKRYGMYRYFDRDTLDLVKYYAQHENRELSSIIGANTNAIENLGFKPDNEVEGELEASSNIDKAKDINLRLRDMTLESIKETIDSVYTESTIENEPIKI